MDDTICYLNTDLDLKSTDEPTSLLAALKAGGLFALHVTRGDDGWWHATLETESSYAEPELNIAAILDVIESLPAALRTMWNSCQQREFNIGYDCGTEPWAFTQGLSPGLLSRIALVSASLQITLYPDRGQKG